MNTIKRNVPSFVIAALLIAVAFVGDVSGVFAGKVASAGYGGDKVTICHKTSSTKNPYEEITINQNAVKAHMKHTGDIIPAPAAGCPTK